MEVDLDRENFDTEAEELGFCEEDHGESREYEDNKGHRKEKKYEDIEECPSDKSDNIFTNIDGKDRSDTKSDDLGG